MTPLLLRVVSVGASEPLIVDRCDLEIEENSGNPTGRVQERTNQRQLPIHRRIRLEGPKIC